MPNVSTVSILSKSSIPKSRFDQKFAREQVVDKGKEWWKKTTETNPTRVVGTCHAKARQPNENQTTENHSLITDSLRNRRSIDASMKDRPDDIPHFRDRGRNGFLVAGYDAQTLFRWKVDEREGQSPRLLRKGRRRWRVSVKRAPLSPSLSLSLSLSLCRSSCLSFIHLATILRERSVRTRMNKHDLLCIRFVGRNSKRRIDLVDTDLEEDVFPHGCQKVSTVEVVKRFVN